MRDLCPPELLNHTTRINPGFRFPDGVSLSECVAAQPLTAAQRHRLVKAAKSPTPLNLKKLTDFQQYTREATRGGKALALDGGECLQTGATYAPGRELGAAPGQRGAYTVIQLREWSDEYRIRTRVENQAGTKPPDQAGARESWLLTNKAAGKIADSCDYMARKKGGYTTFLTATFDDAARARIDAGEVTIQREVSRLMDAFQKMYQRGWQADNGEAVAGHPDKLHYCWVVEIPKNEDGEDNPHVHILMRWRVRYRHFEQWCARVERLWGHGFAHLEKIKDPLCAGAYMAKAAGYMTKGQEDGQGLVKGNRYGISQPARAPAWETISEHALHIMGRLIADVADYITERHGAAYRARAAENAALNACKQANKASHKGRTRQAIGQALQQARAAVNAIPARASKYQIVLKGKAAYIEFINWATTSTNWRLHPVEWLPEKSPIEKWEPGIRPQSRHLGEILQAHYWRRDLRRRKPHGWQDEQWAQLAGEYDLEAHGEPITWAA